MCLSRALCVFDALLDNGLGLLDKLTVQIDRVRVYLAYSVVLAKDELRSLSVVVVRCLRMLFTLLGRVVCACAISAFISLSRLGDIVSNAS